jgi:hypothetical protein
VKGKSLTDSDLPPLTSYSTQKRIWKNDDTSTTHTSTRSQREGGVEHWWFDSKTKPVKHKVT